MNKNWKGKAPLECAEGRVAKGKLVIKTPAEPYSSDSGLENKRKVSSVLEKTTTDFTKSRRASKAAGYPPSYDFRRNIQVERSSSQCYPNGNKDQAQYLNGWEDMQLKKKCSTILLADILTKAAAEATSFSRVLLETQEINEAKVQEAQQRIIELENQLEKAKDLIKSLIVLEKEYSQIFGDMNKRFEYINDQIAQIKDYSAQMMQHYSRALIAYMKKVENLQASQQQLIKPITTENQEVHRPVLTRGFNLVVQAARAANPNFSLQTDFGSSSLTPGGSAGNNNTTGAA